MDLRVLLVESDPDDARFLHEVLGEIEDQHYLGEWPCIEVLHAATWSEAEQIVNGAISSGTGTPHVLLLDPELADLRGAAGFWRAQAAAADIPVVLLVSSEDQCLALKLMREGAQDFLLKKQLDCLPLAHAIRNAIARQRLLVATRATVPVDSLTGLLNRTGFMAVADRDRMLAERLNCRWMLLIAEPKNPAELAEAQREQGMDLEMVEAADHLRSASGPADLMARIGSRRFAICVFDTEAETVEEAWMRIRSTAAERRFEVGASIFDKNRPLSLEAMLEQASRDLMPAPSPETIRAAGAA